MTDVLHTPDANRSVGLAIRSMLVLGIACTLFGLTFVIAFGFFNTFERFRPYFILIGTVLWLGPGLLFLFCTYWMHRHASSSAAAVALGTTVFQAIGALALLVAASTFDPVSPLPIVMCVMWLITLGDCVRHLLRARRFLSRGTDRVHGFEAIATPRPALPMNDEE
jgi:hypothetical protein